MRYEMRLLENGWAVWDTEKNAPASVEGRWRTGMSSIAEARSIADQLNRTAGWTFEAVPYPAPEEDLGGGDICSLEEQPSTDDDKPLD